MAARADRVGPVLLQPFADGTGGDAGFVVFLERRDVGRRRGGRGAEHVLEQPLAAQDGRRAVRVRRHRQQAPLAEQAAAGVMRALQLDPPEVVAVDPRHSVMPRQPFVDEGVIGGQQVEDAPVVPHLAVEEERHLPLHRLAQVGIEVRKRLRVGRHQPDVPEVEPLPAEVVDERLRARIGQHAADLPSEHIRVAQVAALGGGEELVVRDAAPQEEGQARGQLDVRHRIGRAGRDVFRVRFAAEQEVRAHQNAAQRHFYSRVEVALRATLPVEVEQHRHVVAGHGAPERQARQARDDLRRAPDLVHARVGTAREDAPARRRVAPAGGVVRPAHLDIGDRRRDGLIAGVLVTGHPVVGAQHALEIGGLVDEADAERGRSRLRRETDLLPVVRDVAQVAAHFLAVRVEERSADGQGVDQLAVEPDLELMPVQEAAHLTVVGPQQEDPHRVLAVEREVVLYGQPAAGGERQLVADAPVLAQVLVHLVDIGGRLQGGIAHREAADLARRGEIALGQHRRHRQDVGDVVEAEAGIIGREQRRRVDLQVEQVADRVGVLRAVQSMDGVAPARIRIASRRRVDPAREPRRKGLVGRFVGARPRGRRHGPGPEFPDDLLPGFRLVGIVAGAGQVELLQREAGRERPVVVAADAVTVQQLAVFRRPGAVG